MDHEGVRNGMATSAADVPRVGRRVRSGGRTLIGLGVLLGVLSLAALAVVLDVGGIAPWVADHTSTCTDACLDDKGDPVTVDQAKDLSRTMFVILLGSGALLVAGGVALRSLGRRLEVAETAR